MQIFVVLGWRSTTVAPQGLSPARSMQRYPPRQSPLLSHFFIQKVRDCGDVRCGSGHVPTVESTLPNCTQIDSSLGQLVGSQLKMVQ